MGMCIPFCVCFALPVNGLINLTAVVLGILALSQIRGSDALHEPRVCGQWTGDGERDAPAVCHWDTAWRTVFFVHVSSLMNAG